MSTFGGAVFSLVAEYSRFMNANRDAARSLEQVQSAGDAAARAVDGTSATAAQSAGLWDRMSGAIDQHARGIERAGRGMTTMITGPVVAGIAGGALAFANFDQAMTRSTAVMTGVTSAMRDDMAAAAREVASTTTVSATQAAEAYYFLASAGFDAASSIEVLPQVAAFAQAGAFDMATATELAASATASLGLRTTDTAQYIENMGRVTDVLTRQSQLSGATVQQFADAMSNGAGAAARQAGLDVEQTAAILGVFADAGIRGSEAGTLVSAMLRDLTTKAVENRDAFAQLGVRVFDANGALLPMAEIAASVRDSLGPMSAEQRAAALSSLGLGDEARRALGILQGGVDTLGSYESAARDAGGTVQEVADNQMQSMSNRLQVVKNDLTNAGIVIGEQFLPYLVQLAEWIARAAEWFGNLPGPIQGVVGGLVLMLAAVGPVLSHVRDLQQVMGLFRRTTDEVTGAVSGGLSPAMAGVGLAVAAVTAAVMIYNDRKAEQRERINDVTNALYTETGAIDTSTEAWEQWALTQSEFSDNNQLDDLDRMGVSIERLTEMLSSGADGYAEFIAAAIDSGEVTTENRAALDELVDALARGEIDMGDFNQALWDAHSAGEDLLEGNTALVASFHEEAQAMERSAEQQLENLRLTDDLTESQMAQVDAIANQEGATGRAVRAMELASEFLGETTEGTDELAEVQEDLAGVVDDTSGAVDDQTAALAELDDQLNEFLDTVLGAIEGEIDYEDQLSRTQGAIWEVTQGAYNLAAGVDAQGEALGDTTQAQRDLEGAMRDAHTEILDQANAYADLQAALAAENGEVYTATQRQADLVGELERVRDTLSWDSPLRAGLDEYIARLTEDVPAGVDTEIVATTDSSSWDEYAPDDREALVYATADETQHGGWGRYDPETKTSFVVPFVEDYWVDRWRPPDWTGIVYVRPVWEPTSGYGAGSGFGLAAGGVHRDGVVLAASGFGSLMPRAPRAGRVNRPAIIVGEGNPTYEEFVIPTDPTYGARARQLFSALAPQLGYRVRGNVIAAAAGYGSVAAAAGGSVGAGGDTIVINNPEPRAAETSLRRVLQERQLIGEMR